MMKRLSMYTCSHVYGDGGLAAKLCPTLETSWTVARQAPLSVGFPRQEYWSGLSFPFPGDLTNLRIKPMSPALTGRFLPTEPPGKSIYVCLCIYD